MKSKDISKTKVKDKEANTRNGYKNLKPIVGKMLENIQQSKNGIYLTDEAKILEEIIKIVNKQSRKDIYIGVIKDNTAERMYKDTKINVKDFRILFNNSDLLHWYNRHVLNKANRMPMKLSDIFLFVELLDRYDSIKVKIEKDGTIKLELIWEVDKMIVSVSVVSTCKNRISFKTMYYYKKIREIKNSL